MTTLVMAGLFLFGAIGYVSLPVADLPQRRLPDDQRGREPPRREPRDDGGRRRDAARAAVLGNRGDRLDELHVEPGLDEHHAPVLARPRHRRGGAGRPDGDRGHALAASAVHAEPAEPAQGQPGDAAGPVHRPVLADPPDVRGLRVGRDRARAAHLDRDGRRAGERLRLEEVRRAHPGGPRACSRAGRSGSTRWPPRSRRATRTGRSGSSTAPRRRCRSRRTDAS